jgi:uncharacterized membrane protein YkoI
MRSLHLDMEDAMRHTKAMSAALAADLLLSASSLAFAASQRTAGQAGSIASWNPAISAAAIVAAVAGQTKGTVLDINYSSRNGKGEYRAHFLKDGKLMAVRVDPLTGMVGVPTDVKSGLMPLLSEEQAAINAVTGPSLSLQLAIDRAERRLSGMAIDARLLERNGRPRYQIMIARDSRLNRIDIDPNSGKILDLAPGAAAAEPAADRIR